MGNSSDRHVLLVDDDDPTRQVCRELLRKEGFHVKVVGTGFEALRQMQTGFEGVVVMELQLPDQDGTVVFQQLRAVAPDIPVIFLSSQGSTLLALDVIRDGAFQFIDKELLFDRLPRTVLNAFEAFEEARRARTPTPSGRIVPMFGEFLTQARVMMPVFRTITNAAESEVSVLIHGESGTGKELVARALHTLGPRAPGPFVAINCAGIPEPLLEAELFGHERGAFTGANSRRRGRFEAAKGGTLFLDEIGEMHPSLQAKLLRVLQESEFQRLGSNECIQTDLRVIAATNRELETEIEEGRFRSDLYYRLAVYTVYLPPLRERSGDVKLLAMHFLKQFAKREGKVMGGIDAKAMELLELHDYPGNVRELENTVSYAVVSSRDDVITLADLPPSFLRAVAKKRRLLEEEDPSPAAGAAPLPGDFPSLQQMERQHIETAMRLCDGNKTAAANLLGVSRMTLYRKLSEYEIELD